MNRKMPWLACALLASCSGDPATRVIDGYEASYSGDGAAAAFTVTYSDDQSARLWAGKRRGLIVHDGKDYLVGERRVDMGNRQFRMEPIAALRADVAAVRLELARAREQRDAQATRDQGAGAGGDAVNRFTLPDGRVIEFKPPPVYEFQVIEIGKEVVDGRDGRVFRIKRVGDTLPVGIEAVMSDDPQLAVVGRLVRQHFAPDEQVALLPKGTQRNYARAHSELFSKGTLLRLSARGAQGQIQQLYRLKQFGPAKFKGAVLMLPPRVETRAQVAESLDVLALESGDTAPPR